jgi:cobalt-zinc-cadmium efflux system membrane fusion protein
VFTASTFTAAQAQEHAQEPEKTHEEHDEGSLKLAVAEQKEAGVVIAKVEKRPVAKEVTAPGEITLDFYRSADVTPRIEAQVVKRHAALGDIVKQGQPLVMLSSVEMTEA